MVTITYRNQQLKKPDDFRSTKWGMSKEEAGGSEEIKSESPADFRSTKWGMSKEEVRRAEDIELQDYKNSLMGVGEIGKYKCCISYAFHDKALVQGFYFIENDSRERTYWKIQGLLEKKYGTGSFDMKLTDKKYENMYKGKVSKENIPIEGIIKGYLTVSTNWFLSSKVVNLLMLSNNGEDLEIVIRYTVPWYYKVLQTKEGE